ncbi:SigB/SigF/SigG family RNA polymerase sigma factor [Paractinoplanes rishiriensis]|nr:SigB/SigF/SigG family RNA polymerase sigma factor [Actinoplanes rishiriensis]
MPDDRGSAVAEPLEDLDAVAAVYADRYFSAPDGDRAALRDAFVGACLPMAGRLARRFRGRGEPLDDLEQVARLGLIKAIVRFEPDRGSFTAYAVVTIRGEIKRHFRDRAWAMHVPRHVKDLHLAVRRTTEELTAERPHTPTITEIAERLGVNEDEVADAMVSGGGYSPMSLNSPVNGSEQTIELGDLLGGTDPALELVDDRVTVAGLLQRLPARERQMLAMRFQGNQSQSEIAATFGISQMQVSRLLARALAWLREAMLSDEVPRWTGASAAHELAGLDITSRGTNGVLTLRCRGEIDRDSARRLRAALRQAVAARPQQLTVDLSGVALVDAAGVAVLHDGVTAAERAGVRMRLAGVQPYVRHILDVSGLGTSF